MIVRNFVVLLCSLAGHFSATNGLYLNFAAPKNKALDTRQNYAEDHNQRNVDKLFRKGRHHHKKLLILDRKDKRVDDFVKKIMSVIEMNEGDKLLNGANYDKRKMNCRHLSFGSIYNAKAKRKRCKKQHPVYKRKQPWINFVIPIPLKRTIFSDTTRQGFSDDYLIDFNRRADIDFDYYNTVNRAHVDSKSSNDYKEASSAKETKTLIEVIANNGESDATPKSLRRDHTRFKIVPNQYDSVEHNDKRDKNKNPMPSDNSDSDDTDNSEGDNKNKAKENSDSDPEKYKKSKLPMKKIRDEWNDIIHMPDIDPGSSEESSPPKKQERNKNTYETNSSKNGDSDSDASDFDHKKYKDKGDNEKYVYMQGHRVYNANLDSEESRRMRNKNYFLPKRSYWNENSMKRLGPYWNSHEIAGVHID